MISRIIKVEEGVMRRSRKPRLISITETLSTLQITKPLCNITVLLDIVIQKKWKLCYFATSLTPSNTKRVNLT